MGTRRTEGTEGAEEDERDEGAEGDDGGCYIYIVRWLGNHGNRLYGFMGLRSKISEWSGWIPLRLL